MRIYNGSNGSGDVSSSQKSGIGQYGRVYDVLLSDSPSEAAKFEVPSGSIGAIKFKFLTKGVDSDNPSTQRALPIDARMRAFPIKGELVEILEAPTKDSKDAQSNNYPAYYYKTVIDVWGSPEHNSRPDSQTNLNAGPVTGNFVEKGSRGRLLHLPGDFILEGRFGNGIRVGSSNNKTSLKSPWKGSDSSPLVIISNNKKSSKLSFEEINKDGSSMYILSDQSIPFDPASLNFESYEVNMRIVQQESVVKTKDPEPVQPAPVSQAALPEKESVAIQPEQKPLPPPVTQKDPVEELPDAEPVSSDQAFQEYESLIVGTTRSANGISYIKDYIIDDKTFRVDGTERLAGTSPKNARKGKFRNLPFRDFTRTPSTIELFAKNLNDYVQKGLLTKNLARSVLGIAINEQGGTDGFNNNFWGMHSDIGAFSRANSFPNVNPTYQVLAREGGTGRMRAYLGFNTLDDAIKYVSDVLQNKDFHDLTYGAEEENNFTRLYIERWWGNENVSAATFNLKKQGYVKAKKLIP